MLKAVNKAHIEGKNKETEGGEPGRAGRVVGDTTQMLC